MCWVELTLADRFQGWEGMAHGGIVEYVPERGRLGELVAPLLREGDVLLTMGAGDVTRLGPEVRERLERR